MLLQIVSPKSIIRGHLIALVGKLFNGFELAVFGGSQKIAWVVPIELNFEFFHGLSLQVSITKKVNSLDRVLQLWFIGVCGDQAVSD